MKYTGREKINIVVYLAANSNFVFGFIREYMYFSSFLLSRRTSHSIILLPLALSKSSLKLLCYQSISLDLVFVTAAYVIGSISSCREVTEIAVSHSRWRESRKHTFLPIQPFLATEISQVEI